MVKVHSDLKKHFLGKNYSKSIVLLCNTFEFLELFSFISILPDPKIMVSVAGTYQYESQENFEDLLESMGMYFIKVD